MRVGGMGAVIGLDSIEIRNRVRPGFNASRVLTIALAAETAIVEASAPKDGETDGT